jgi:excisionase family DNA binding protein
MSDIYNKTEAAKKLKISIETINRNLKSGKLPYRKIGQRVIFTESDLTAFLEACAVSRKGAKETNNSSRNQPCMA